jgi:hypothetical protein
MRFVFKRLKSAVNYIYFSMDYFGGNTKERDHWDRMEVDGCIILKWILEAWDGKMCSRCTWLGAGLL